MSKVSNPWVLAACLVLLTLSTASSQQGWQVQASSGYAPIHALSFPDDLLGKNEYHAIATTLRLQRSFEVKGRLNPFLSVGLLQLNFLNDVITSERDPTTGANLTYASSSYVSLGYGLQHTWREQTTARLGLIHHRRLSSQRETGQQLVFSNIALGIEQRVHKNLSIGLELGAPLHPMYISSLGSVDPETGNRMSYRVNAHYYFVGVTVGYAFR